MWLLYTVAASPVRHLPEYAVSDLPPRWRLVVRPQHSEAAFQKAVVLGAVHSTCKVIMTLMTLLPTCTYSTAASNSDSLGSVSNLNLTVALGRLKHIVNTMVTEVLYEVLDSKGCL